MQSESEILIGTKFMDLGVGGGSCFKYFLNLRSKITESIIFFGLPPLGKFLGPRMELTFSCTLIKNVHTVYCAFVAMAIEQI